MEFIIPETLAAACREDVERAPWLRRLPDIVSELQQRWSLRVHAPFQGVDGTAAWVAPVTRSDGSAAVLKLGFPHMEAEHEMAGLSFWNGQGIVRLLESDESLHALLLERCIPGTSLRELPEEEQDAVLGELLSQLWRVPPPGQFRPLSEMLQYWARCTLRDEQFWPDPALVRAGLRVLTELLRDPAPQVPLLTDLHAGNVLRAERATWLAIDPKPFVGDPTYDATQHLLNCTGRMTRDPLGTIARVSTLLGLQRERLQLWMFGRAAAGPRRHWQNDPWIDIARRIAP